MAGDWIKMRSNLWDDPRVTRVVDIVNVGEAAVVGALYWLWATADQHSEDGVMPGLSLRAIDRKTGVPGLGDALVTIGWLTEHPEGVQLCRFEEHNGESAKRRCVDAQRKANVRKSSDKSQTDDGQDADELRRISELEKEKRKEEKKETKSKAKAPATPQFDPLQELLSLGVAEQIALDWLVLRKSKRAPVSQTALRDIIKEAEKAAMSLESALATGCKRGWTGFEAAWVTQQPRASPATPEKFDPASYVNRNRIKP